LIENYSIDQLLSDANEMRKQACHLWKLANWVENQAMEKAKKNDERGAHEEHKEERSAL